MSSRYLPASKTGGTPRMETGICSPENPKLPLLVVIINWEAATLFRLFSFFFSKEKYPNHFYWFCYYCKQPSAPSSSDQFWIQICWLQRTCQGSLDLTLFRDKLTSYGALEILSTIIIPKCWSGHLISVWVTIQIVWRAPGCFSAPVYKQ